jgi:hypothetical protein
MSGFKTVIFITMMFCFHEISAYSAVSSRGIGLGSYVPAPRLLSPGSENVNLGAKPYMTFRWSPHEKRLFGGNYYDFRIYSGTDMLESTLIYKEEVSGSLRRLEVSSDLFEEGRIYTWSLRQRYKSYGKSPRSIRSFRVTK